MNVLMLQLTLYFLNLCMAYKKSPEIPSGLFIYT